MDIQGTEPNLRAKVGIKCSICFPDNQVRILDLLSIISMLSRHANMEWKAQNLKKVQNQTDYVDGFKTFTQTIQVGNDARCRHQIFLEACIIKTGLDRPWIDLAFYITYWGSTLAMKKLKNIQKLTESIPDMILNHRRTWAQKNSGSSYRNRRSSVYQAARSRQQFSLTVKSHIQHALEKAQFEVAKLQKTSHKKAHIKLNEKQMAQMKEVEDYVRKQEELELSKPNATDLLNEDYWEDA